MSLAVPEEGLREAAVSRRKGEDFSMVWRR